MCIELKYIERAADGDIAKVGGKDISGVWGITTQRAVDLINSGEWAFFVRGDDSQRTEVLVVTRGGKRHLQTRGDSSTRNNLGRLPERSLPTMECPPFHVQGARIPRFIRVLKGGPEVTGPTPTVVQPVSNAVAAFRHLERLHGQNTEIAPGAYGVLPAGSTIVEFTAPLLVEHDIRVFEHHHHGTESRHSAIDTPLPEGPPSATEARAAGWYEVLSVHTEHQFEPLWRVAIVPPAPLRRGSGYLLVIGNRVKHEDCWGQERKTIEQYRQQKKAARRPDPYTKANYDVPMVEEKNGRVVTPVRHVPLTMALRITRSRDSTRRRLTTLSDAERWELSGAIWGYITNRVVNQHDGKSHTGVDFLIDHREILTELEHHLWEMGLTQYLPLPMWSPDTPIPLQFLWVKRRDDGSPQVAPNGEEQTTLDDPDPDNPVPAQLTTPYSCLIQDVTAVEKPASDPLNPEKKVLGFSERLQPWHDEIHTQQFTHVEAPDGTVKRHEDSGNGNGIGGAMGFQETAAAAAIFYPWHAYVDELFHRWEHCK